MQSELDDIIEQGVVQITRLLKNSESSSPSSDSIEEDFNVARHKHNYLRGIFLKIIAEKVINNFLSVGADQRNFNKNHIGKGRLTERLLAQGLLTPNMLDELQKEWNKVSRYIFSYLFSVAIIFLLKALKNYCTN